MKKNIFTLLVMFIALSFNYYSYSQSEPPTDLEGSSLRTWLKTNWYNGYHNDLGYDEARSQMYGYIDKRADNQLYCVYTGYHVNATYSTGSVGSINCEHTIPQSWFNSASPMKNDIFHLYPTHGDVNSARGSLSFADVNDNNTDKWYIVNSSNSGLSVETSIPTSNIDDYSELKTNSYFEPREDHKGDVARSAFYFYTMYPTQAGDINNLCDIDVLYQWHLEDPVDDWEMQRNNRIEEQQGNRNPYIDHPEIVCRAWGLECPAQFNFTSTPITSILVNTQYNYTITFEGENVTLSCSNKPDWLTFTNGASGTANLQGTPNAMGDFAVSLSLSDGTYSVNQNFTINVNDGNIPVNIFNKDFEDQSLTSGNWLSFSVLGDEQVWNVPETQYGHNGTYCVYMSGYNDGAVINEDWLISPPVDLNNYNSEKLSFWNASKYDGNDLQVYYSDDYSGTGSPADATWTEITGFTLSTGDWAWVSSGEIDISDIEGDNVYFGFKYTSDNVNAIAWELDDIVLEAKQNVSISENIIENSIDIYPNPVSNNLNIEYSLNQNTQVTIDIYDITGKKIENIQNEYQTSGKHTINWNVEKNIQNGIYILKIQTEMNTISKKIILKQ